MIRRFCRIAGVCLSAALVFALATVGIGVASDRTDDVDYVVDCFDQIVFHAEFGQKIEPRISKWVDPLAVYLDIRAGDPTLYHRLVVNHLADIRWLTGLEYEIVDSPDKANYYMVFERDDALMDAVADYMPTLSQHGTAISETLCFGIYSVNGGSEIKRAIIGIPTDRATSMGKLPACIVEEMTQVLGLPNDSDDISPSIFNDHSIDDALTALDRMLVRILYDPTIYVGMPRDEALVQARALAHDPLIAEQPATTPAGRDSASANPSGSTSDPGVENAISDRSGLSAPSATENTDDGDS